MMNVFKIIKTIIGNYIYIDYNLEIEKKKKEIKKKGIEEIIFIDKFDLDKAIFIPKCWNKNEKILENIIDHYSKNLSAGSFKENK